jgi:hypothetical protein
MKRNDKFRVLAVIMPRGSADLDGGSSTVDRRLVAAEPRRAEARAAEAKPKGGTK